MVNFKGKKKLFYDKLYAIIFYIKIAFQIAPNLVKDELMANQSSNQFENNKNNRMLKIQNFVTNLFPIKNNQTNIELNSSEYDKLKSHKFYLIKFATLAKCDKFTDENLKYDYSPYYVLAEVNFEF
jgi:hypothetical protein